MRSGLVAALALAAVLAGSGCDTGGVAKGGDASQGKQLFTTHCGVCHTLADAGTRGTVGPDLDGAFAADRAQGFHESTIKQVVYDQIRYASGRMPRNVVTGQDAASVAAYVASVAGTGSGANGAPPTTASGSNPSAGGGGAGGSSAASGKAIFTSNCGGCHTLADAGTTGTTGRNLDQLKPSFAVAHRQVIHGGAVMPPFKGVLTPQQITAVAKYVSSVAGKKK